MKELFDNHKMRLFIYITLSMLSFGALYSAGFIAEVYKRTVTNATNIMALERRIAEREKTAAEYVPRLEKLEELFEQRAALIDRVILRQMEINKRLDTFFVPDDKKKRK